MKADKELYRRLRLLPAERLWGEEVPRFDGASPAERLRGVAVIRAVGVAFAGNVPGPRKAEVRAWLVRLLQDPAEKVRRYAAAALPKIGAGPEGEGELLALLRKTAAERERRHVGRALDKIGGRATLAAAASVPGLPPQTEQKVRARLARREQPGALRRAPAFADFANLRIHLRCRRGLEGLLRDEVAELVAARGGLRIAAVEAGCVAVAPLAPFSLDDLYRLRCFASAGFVIGGTPASDPVRLAEAVAAAIASPLSRRLMETFTEGPVRYRIDFVGGGHRRGAIREVANLVYARCPDLLNDARRAPWSVDVRPGGRGTLVELRPRLLPDPRWFYRRDDVAAASHPPLAACLARLAGPASGEVAWDPFCGSGLELVERALRGGVRLVVGTDRDPAAVAVARANFAAAGLASVEARFLACDFRDLAAAGLGPDSADLVITNPPMGRRIRIPDLRGLFADLFSVAATVLRPGGRLVFPNPLRPAPAPAAFALEGRAAVDLGGFDCRLEKYRRTGSPAPAAPAPVHEAVGGDTRGERP